MTKDIYAYIDEFGNQIRSEYVMNNPRQFVNNQVSDDGLFRYRNARKYIFGLVHFWKIIKQ